MSDRLRAARDRAQRVWDVVHRGLAHIDPNDDPDAEPLGVIPVVLLIAGVAMSSWMYMRWRYQPMQDFYHYAAMAAVVSDWGHHGSLYTPLYDKADLLAANSLIYTIAGVLGRVIGVTIAMKLSVLTYVAGMPLLTLYGLRVFGRSAWPALIAVPLVFWNLSFVAGFVNMLVSAPLMLASLLVTYRLFVKPTRWRLAGAMVLFATTFMVHAQTYLWTGALAFLMTVGFAFAAMREPTVRRSLKRAGVVMGMSFGAVLPSLVLFYLWYRRSFGAAASDGTTNHLGSSTEGFGAQFLQPQQQFESLFGQFHVFADGNLDAKLLTGLAILTLVALALSRYHRYAKPPLLELACVITGLSYFFLPESIKGQEIIAQRQPGVALWLLPALLSPVPWRASRVARGVVVAGIVLLSWLMLSTWRTELMKFEKEEAAGLDTVMKAAPPRSRLHYVKTDPNSAYFNWRPFWHVEKAIMSDKLGQTADTGGINATASIHYRPGVEIHRITDHSPYWPDNPEIWHNFDVVLVRRWHPTADMLRRASQHGERIAQSGDWELWQSHEATPAVTGP